MTILAQGDQHVQKQIRKRSNADLSDIETMRRPPVAALPVRVVIAKCFVARSHAAVPARSRPISRNR